MLARALRRAACIYAMLACLATWCVQPTAAQLVRETTAIRRDGQVYPVRQSESNGRVRRAAQAVRQNFDSSEVASLRAIDTSVRALAASVDSARAELARPRRARSSDWIQPAGLFVTLIAAALSAYWASRSAYLLAQDRGREEKRQFCFELQTQFDSPQMFDCRYKAWQKLDKGDFASVTNVSQLLSSSHWTFEVSTVIHFFESLNRYCDEGLVDSELATKLFGRTYQLWYDRLLSHLAVDESALSYREWFSGICAFERHVVAAGLKRPAPSAPARAGAVPPAE